MDIRTVLASALLAATGTLPASGDDVGRWDVPGVSSHAWESHPPIERGRAHVRTPITKSPPTPFPHPAPISSVDVREGRLAGGVGRSQPRRSVGQNPRFDGVKPAAPGRNMR